MKSVRAATFDDLDDMFSCLKEARIHREAEWQMIADAFMPRKDFTLRQKPTELRRRRLTSSVPTIALARGAALLVAHLIDHTRPFIRANVKRGLVAAGRSTQLDKPGLDYLNGLEWTIRDAMMLPRSGFLTSVSRLAMELEGFGTAVAWGTRKRGFGPNYQCLPLRACWISEDEEGVVDTLFYQVSMPIWKAVARWPGHGIESWRKAMSDEDGDRGRQRVTITRAVYPRMNGQYGAVAEAKPFAEVYFVESEKTILGESGYDSFPGAVPRLNVEEGSAYGTGMAWQALPEALVLNALQDSIERGVSLKVDPPLMIPKRMFAKALDRRPGTVQTYDPASLSFMNAQQAIQRMDISGDVTVASDYLRRLEQNVEQAFFIDWMRLRDSGTMTAEEVRERRNMRISAMSAIVPGVDRDLMGPIADRTLDILNAEGFIETPPPELSGVDVEWDYLGPLAIAQLKGQADAISQAMQSVMVAKEIEPQAAYVFDVEEGLRAISDALALPPAVLRSRESVAERRAQEEQAQALAQNTELLGQAAGAVRDGGQGIDSLTRAFGGQGGGAMPQAA